MHESIAKARLAGFKRKALLAAGRPSPKMQEPYFRCHPKKYVEEIQRRLDKSPCAFQMLYTQNDIDRHEQQHLWVTAEPHAVNGWTLAQVKVNTRFRTREINSLRLHLSDHLIVRVMQRADIRSPEQALRFIGEALPAADAIGAGYGDGGMVPMEGGAVFMKKIYLDDEIHWMLTTFVDDEKLQPDQRVMARLAAQRATDNNRRGL